MKVIGGLRTDTLPISNPDGSWIDGWNGLLSSKFNSPTNEWGFFKYDNNYNGRTDLVTIGAIQVNDGSTIIFSIKETLYSEIGLLAVDGTYTVKLDESQDTTNAFNFQWDKQITGETKINGNGDIIFVFTDNFNTPKVVNLTTLAATTAGTFEINDFMLYPDYRSLYLDEANTTILDYGGNILSGTYYFAYTHKFFDGSETGYTNVTRPFYINATPESLGIYSTGCPANTPTNKQIKLVFDYIDIRFDIISLSVICVNDGIITAYDVIDINVNDAVEITYLFTGTEDLTEITQLAIQSRNEIYKTIKSLTTVNKQLYGANVTQAENIKYQKYACNVEVKFEVDLVDVADLKDYDIINQKTLMPDEVYSFRMGFNMTDGSKSKLFHIPGRVSGQTIGDISPLDYAGGGGATTRDLFDYSTLTALNALSPTTYGFDIDGALATYFFETRCTCKATAASTTDIIGGYWENNNEEYVTNNLDADLNDYNGAFDYDGVDIVGGRNLITEVSVYNGGAGAVKHHRTPSMEWLKAELYPVNDDFGRNKIPRIKVNFSNKVIPQYLIDAGIESIFYVIDKKTPENSLVIGQDRTHLFATDVSVGTPNTDSLLNVAANIIVADTLNAGQMDAYNAARANTIRIKSHCPDLLINTPNIAISYIKYYVTTRYEYPDWITQDATYGWTGYTDLSDNINTDLTLVGVASRFSEVANAQYIPNGVIVPINGKNVDNRFSEYCYHFIADRLSMNTLGAGDVREQDGGGVKAQTEYSSLYTMYQYKQNVHNLYSETDFVELFIQEEVGLVTGYIDSGDCFLCDYCYNSYGYRTLTDYASADYQKGIKLAHRYLTISRHNINYRNVTGDHNNYLPVGSPTVYLPQIYRYDDPSPQYNQDYSYQNSFNVYECWSPYQQFITNHPYRIIRAVKPTATDIVETWREFLPNDFYELIENKGEIWNIQGLSDGNLLIHNNSLYKTRGITQMATDTASITLGVGDLFEFPPQEIIADKFGYLGTQHRIACKLNKQGYCFIDAQLGRLFIVSGSEVKELSIEGMRNFFKDNSLVTFNTVTNEIDDNPITSMGWNIEYDEYFNRLLCSKKDYKLKALYQSIYTTDTAKINSIDPEADWFSFQDLNTYAILFPNSAANTNDNRYTLLTYTVAPPAYGTPITVIQSDETYFDNYSFCISYSFDYKEWAFFHNYIPDYIFKTRNQLLSVKDNKIFLHNNADLRGVYYNYELVDGEQLATPYEFIITPCFNLGNEQINKWFYALMWNTNVIHADGSIAVDETFDILSLWNSYQAQSAQALVPFTDIDNIYTENTRSAKGIFSFNSFRDAISDRTLPFLAGGDGITPISTTNTASLSSENKKRFVDKFVVLKFVFSNSYIVVISPYSQTQNSIYLIDCQPLAKAVQPR